VRRLAGFWWEAASLVRSVTPPERKKKKNFDHSPLLSWLPLDAIGLSPIPPPPPPVALADLPPWQRIQRPINAASKARASDRMRAELTTEIDELCAVLHQARTAIDTTVLALDSLPPGTDARTPFLQLREHTPCLLLLQTIAMAACLAPAVR